jgi:hypothetical protein
LSRTQSSRRGVGARGTRFVIVLLFLLVLLSLALNGYLVWQWLTFRAQAQALADRAEGLRRSALEAIAQLREELEGIDDATFEYRVQIDEDLPIDAVVPFHERFEVPIQATVPISQEFATTLDLQIPQLGVNLPVEVAVPVQLEVPIDLTVPVEIDREVPIRTTVPISLEVPVVIDLADVGLARYVELLDRGLADLEEALAGAFPF